MALGEIAALGRSASICGRLIVSCRSSRLGSFARASPLSGPPPLAPLRLRCLRLRSRRIAVASREMRWRSAQSSHADGSDAAASEKARENVGRTAGIARHQGRASRRRNVEHGLVLAAALHGRGSRASVDPRPVPERDEQLVALAHRAKLALEPREQRAGTRLHSSVGHGVLRQDMILSRWAGPTAAEKSPQLFCKWP